MGFIKKTVLIVFISALLGLTGCASQTYKKEAFARNNKFGIVSITGITSGFGFSNQEEETMVSNFEKLITRELGKTRHFKLVSSKSIQNSRTYKRIKGESTDGVFQFKTAPGYKKFDHEDEKENLKQLDRELKMTGNIFVTLSIVKEDSGFSLSGFLPIPVPVSAGKVHAKVIVAIYATDPNGEVIWSDQIEKITEEGVGHIMGISNFKNLYPQIIDIANNTATEFVKNLDTNLTAAASKS